MILIYAFVLLNVGVVVFSLWATRDLQEFLNRNPRISGDQSLEEYRQIARKNMYAALAAIVVLLAALALSLTIILRFGLTGLAISLTGNVLIFVLSAFVKKYEKRAKTLPADTEELAAQYGQITKAWEKRLLPNF
jgi:hypothetical protein